LPPGLPDWTVIGLFALFMVGVGAKAAIMPLHGWLPEAMVAPTPVSALLHAVAVVKAGAFGCLRVVGFVFGVDQLRAVGADTVLAVLAAATILFGSFRALGETHLKRRLAYSTVSQLSYIVLGAALGSVAALAGAMFHIAAHGFMKITMFFCAGAIHTASHRDDVTQLDGLGRQMPITMTAFAIGAAGLAGTPLLAGFVSKWNLGLGALAAGHGVFIAVLVVSGLLNLAYFFPIVYDAFFKPAYGEVEPERLMLTAPLAATALAALLLGVAPDIGVGFYQLAWSAATSVVAGAASGGVP
jgi:multicomponent Na+:H+ antiporter subunit D